MTATGFLVGILAGIGVLAFVLVIAMVMIVRKMSRLEERGERPHARLFEGKGFDAFQQQVMQNLPDAGRSSYVTADLPFPSVEVRIEVAGRAKDHLSYRMEIRLGYAFGPRFKLVARTYFVEQLVPTGAFTETNNRFRIDLDIGF